MFYAQPRKRGRGRPKFSANSLAKKYKKEEEEDEEEEWVPELADYGDDNYYREGAAGGYDLNDDFIDDEEDEDDEYYNGVVGGDGGRQQRRSRWKQFHCNHCSRSYQFAKGLSRHLKARSVRIHMYMLVLQHVVRIRCQQSRCQVHWACRRGGFGPNLIVELGCSITGRR